MVNIQHQVFEKSSLNTELGNAVYCAPNCTAALSHLGVNPAEFGAVLNNGVWGSSKLLRCPDLSKTDPKRYH